jgi:hypothetical protein
MPSSPLRFCSGNFLPIEAAILAVSLDDGSLTDDLRLVRNNAVVCAIATWALGTHPTMKAVDRARLLLRDLRTALQNGWPPYQQVERELARARDADLRLNERYYLSAHHACYSLARTGLAEALGAVRGETAYAGAWLQNSLSGEDVEAIAERWSESRDCFRGVATWNTLPSPLSMLVMTTTREAWAARDRAGGSLGRHLSEKAEQVLSDAEVNVTIQSVRPGSKSEQPSPPSPSDLMQALEQTSLRQRAHASEEDGSTAPLVVLQGYGHPVLVEGQIVSKLTPKQYNVIQALVDARGNLTGGDLVTKSGEENAVKILKGLAEKPEWESVIYLPGKAYGKGYGLADR